MTRVAPLKFSCISGVQRSLDTYYKLVILPKIVSTSEIADDIFKQIACLKHFFLIFSCIFKFWGNMSCFLDIAEKCVMIIF